MSEKERPAAGSKDKSAKSAPVPTLTEAPLKLRADNALLTAKLAAYWDKVHGYESVRPAFRGLVLHPEVQCLHTTSERIRSCDARPTRR